jgi:exopolysaccharide biosynthesis polyprenyl glycosylphosphotransferase
MICDTVSKGKRVGLPTKVGEPIMPDEKRGSVRIRVSGSAMVLLSGDLAILVLALNLAFAVRAGLAGLSPAPLDFMTTRPGISAFILVSYLFSFYVFDLYDPRSWPTAASFGRHFTGAILLSSFFILFYFWLAPFRFGRGLFLLNLAFLSVGILLWRTVIFPALHIRMPVRKIVLVGRMEEKRDLGRFATARGETELAGFVALDPEGKAPIGADFSAEIGRELESTGADILVLSPDFLSRPASNRLVLWARSRGIKVVDYPSAYEEISERVAIDHVSERWILQSRGFRGLENESLRRWKRIMDILVSGAVLVLTLPLTLLIAAAIKLTSRGPILFIQDRVGEGGTPYRILKFRTMIVDAEVEGPQWAEENDLRITRFGRVLRRRRLDELPQFLNVLTGSMSVVGPRPEREFFVRRLEAEIPLYTLRLVTKPGITGWAQIHYHYGASVEDSREKLKLDLYYVRNFSLTLDLKILLRTARVMLFGLGR